MLRPAADEYAPAYAEYVDLVPEEDVITAMEKESSEFQRMLSSLDETRAAFRYAPDKWSVKEVVGHVTDAERVFGYRLLAVARGETQPLPAFDENGYVAAADFDRWRVGDLAECYALVRRANIVLLKNLPEEAWTRRGIANDNEVTVRALAFMIVGHQRHHRRILHERYLAG